MQEFQTFYPVSELLRQFIYCYYILQDTGEDFHTKHYSFPHTYNAVSIYKNARFHYFKNHLNISGCIGSAPFCVLQGKQQNPLLVELSGNISRITILFKPLGLNHFLMRPLGEVLKSDPIVFDSWDSASFDQMSSELFQSTINKNIYLLETFLTDIFRPIDLEILYNAIELLSDFDKSLSIQEIAESQYMSLRNFNRVFRAHLGVSPVAHQRIQRFRHSLENKLFANSLDSFTKIAYDSNFYDQAYFNKLYKQFSGSSPSRLFSTVRRLGDSHVVLQFLSEEHKYSA